MFFDVIHTNCCGLDVHKTWVYACIGITNADGVTVYYTARFSSFKKQLLELADWLKKYKCYDVCMESSGKYWIPVFNVLEAQGLRVVVAHPKYTKPIKGNKSDRRDAKWICNLFACGMIRPSFVPPKAIRDLRELVRYHGKLTEEISSHKNRALNCLTVSNLKLDEVFSDVFCKSGTSILEYIAKHPGEHFDVTPFVNKRCKTPIETIQLAIDGSISCEIAFKLQECLANIANLEESKARLEEEIYKAAKPYDAQLDLIQTVPGFGSNRFSAIRLLSEIGADITVFPTAQNFVAWLGCCPRNDSSASKVKSRRISKAGTYVKPLLVQIANSLVASKKYPEIVNRYRRIKGRRGHSKAIIAVCKMLLTAIWHILKKQEAYTPEGYLTKKPVKSQNDVVLSEKEAVELVRRMGITVTTEEVAKPKKSSRKGNSSKKEASVN